MWFREELNEITYIWSLAQILSTKGMWTIYISHLLKAKKNKKRKENEKPRFHFEKFLGEVELK